jgi:phosphoribosylformylglycinamidine synthase
MKARALVLTGFGINCDYETEFAFVQSGAAAKRVHINDVIENPDLLTGYNILVVPGGFSFGDDIASGKVFANKIKYNLREEVLEFVNGEKLVIGICNGFQAMVKMGLLPFLERKLVQQTTLTFNDSGRFEDRWVHLKINKSPCVFTKGMEKMYLPVRHGEGKFIADENVIRRLRSSGCIVAEYVDENGNHAGYPWNPNGSMEDIAAICDPTGRIFGLMPHPEAHVHRTNHPRWTRGETDPWGRTVFENAVKWIEEKW